jgi:hypothetical protein
VPGEVETAPSVDEKLARLQAQVDDLSEYVARLIDALFEPASWREHEVTDSAATLVWREVLSDEGSPDECDVGWWNYVHDRDGEASDAS